MKGGERRMWRAVVRRDRRQEGRFVVAVRTTGIYCRPGCPARTPLRANVDFFPTPRAAEGAGFRACKRCRPELARWVGTKATVDRAMRLLSEADADGGLERLAERLGVGARHLRRLFTAHLGASPVTVLQRRRAEVARLLVERTKLPMAEIALRAGFGSQRRFNEAFRATWRRTPGEMRRRRGS